MTAGLLVNWVTHPLVGMTVEGLRWVNAFRAANPALRLGLLLNRDAPTALAGCLPALDQLFTVDVAASCAGDRLVVDPPPGENWDYIFTDPRNHAATAHSAFRLADEQLRKLVPAAMGNRGWCRDGLPASRHSPVRLVLPASAREAAATRLPPGCAPLFSIVPGSAAEASRTPPVAFWRQLLLRLRKQYPAAGVVLIGSLRGANQPTLGVDRGFVDGLLGAFDNIVDAVDLPLLEQLALAQRCDVHVSPHTGMAFAIQCVGTPWMALSGAREVEYVFNGVPCVSLYPGCDRYPCGDWVGSVGARMLARCKLLARHGQPYACLGDAELGARCDEILKHVDDLLHGRVDYHAALRRHQAEIVRLTDLPPGANFLEGGGQVLAGDFLF